MPVSIIFRSSVPTVCLLSVTRDTRFPACHPGPRHAKFPLGSSCKALPDQRMLVMTSESKEKAPLQLSDIKEVAIIPEERNVVKVTKQSTGSLPVWRDLLLHPTLSVRHMLICVLGSTSSNKHVASTPSSSIAPLRLSDIKEVAGIPEECNVKLTKQSTGRACGGISSST